MPRFGKGIKPGPTVASSVLVIIQDFPKEILPRAFLLLI